jgi:hypothetical protein
VNLSEAPLAAREIRELVLRLPARARPGAYRRVYEELTRLGCQVSAGLPASSPPSRHLLQKLPGTPDEGLRALLRAAPKGLVVNRGAVTGLPYARTTA